MTFTVVVVRYATMTVSVMVSTLHPTSASATCVQMSHSATKPNTIGIVQICIFRQVTSWLWACMVFFALAVSMAASQSSASTSRLSKGSSAKSSC